TARCLRVLVRALPLAAPVVARAPEGQRQPAAERERQPVLRPRHTSSYPDRRPQALTEHGRQRTDDGGQMKARTQTSRYRDKILRFSLTSELTFFLLAFSVLCSLSSVLCAQPLGIGLEGIDYPYPVRFFDLTVENQPLRM